MAAFVTLGLSNGIPMLRHDWFWPYDRAGFYDYFVRALSGWDPRGLGSPNFFINGYLIALPMVALGSIAGPQLALGALLLVIALLVSFGSVALARSWGADDLGSAATALFALFNPWVYNELVAGHTYMLLAYGAAMMIAAELMRRKARPIVISLLVVLTLQQLQFYVVVMAVIAVFAFLRRCWLPLWTGIIVGIPAWLGIGFGADSFVRVPYTLAWEQAQSVAPQSALLLSGYFADYAAVMWVTHWAMVVFTVIVALGIIVGLRSRLGVAVLAGAAIPTLWAMGLLGPLAPLERYAVLHAPASALFRELYDLLGLTAIAYVAAASAALRAFRAIGLVAFIAGVTMLGSWVASDPAHWWLPANLFPKLAVSARAGSRYALYPAFQPLRYLGQGSGIDRDAVVLPHAVVPLNQTYPSWPVDASLSAFSQSGDVDIMSRLGVSVIYIRPWLASDAAALRFQRALPGAPRRDPVAARIDVAPQPVVALLPEPRIGTLDNRVGDGNVFFADAAGLLGNGLTPESARYRELLPVTAPNVDVDSAKGWVDVRLALAQDPSLGQGLGGALTTSQTALLAVTPGAPALVLVRGKLLSSTGELVAQSTSGYRWVPLPKDAPALRCLGLCVVAAQGFPPAGLPLNPPARRPLMALDARWRLPWLLSANVPAGSAAVARLNVLYNRDWIAWSGSRALPHVRIDTAVNGWFLPQRESRQTVWLVEWLAAVQFAFELAGVAWVSMLLLKLGRRPQHAQAK